MQKHELLSDLVEESWPEGNVLYIWCPFSGGDFYEWIECIGWYEKHPVWKVLGGTSYWPVDQNNQPDGAEIVITRQEWEEYKNSL